MNIAHFMLAAAVMLAATAIAVGFAKKLELGSIVAVLAVGMALGPHSPMPLFTAHVDEIQSIGEIGVMLLLFVIGLDLQPTRLWSMRGLVFGLGSSQYVVTTAVVAAFFAATLGIAGVQWQSALVASLGLAMSSAAIPLPILQERGEVQTTHGRAVLAIDIFQGFMVVPVLALIPILGGAPGQGAPSVEVTKLLEVIAAIGGVYVLGRYILPSTLALTARKLGPSGFAAIVFAGVFFAGWWTDAVGASMALGAFMTGVLLSTTVFAEQVKASVAPARQLLLAIFFIAIGMAIDLKQVIALKSELLLYLPSLLLIKFAVLFALARAFRLGWRAALLTGLLMMPFDEIAFVIFASANANGLLSARDYTVGISVISFSFVVSPLLINLGYKLADRLGSGRSTAPHPEAMPEGNVVVAGYGPEGRGICAMLEHARVPYTAFDVDPERLAKGKESNHNAHYGDFTDPRMLDAVEIRRAGLVVLTMGYDSTMKAIGMLRQFYPRVPVMTAVRFLAQRDELVRMGATHVVALAPEGTLSFGHAVLDRLGIPADKSSAIIDSIKSRDYGALRDVRGGEPPAAAEAA
ncbi:MAG TPA: cation:proton antiporter [Casimicrobiaceae bacterium]|nr:cation:proton antiporter [Casimicrobiaceae bacterium]